MGEPLKDVRVTTWADGFGTWHARVAAGPAQEVLARAAIIVEITERDHRADAARITVGPVATGDRRLYMLIPRTVVYREVLDEDLPVAVVFEPTGTVLARFAMVDEAVQLISGLPHAEDGLYGIDAPEGTEAT